MARRKRILRCSCRMCNTGLHRAGSKRNEVYYANRAYRTRVASLLSRAARSSDESSYDAAQDVIESAGYTD